MTFLPDVLIFGQREKPRQSLVVEHRPECNKGQARVGLLTSEENNTDVANKKKPSKDYKKASQLTTHESKEVPGGS